VVPVQDSKKTDSYIYTWTGTWIGILDGEEIPSREEFEQSENTFTYTLQTTASKDLALTALTSTGSYLLEGESVTDVKQTVTVHMPAAENSLVQQGLLNTTPVTLVTAEGDTQFGSFYSRGTLRVDATGVTVLTLARHYLKDGEALDTVSNDTASTTTCIAEQPSLTTIASKDTDTTAAAAAAAAVAGLPLCETACPICQPWTVLLNLPVKRRRKKRRKLR
jgi:hypothetical protein